MLDAHDISRDTGSAALEWPSIALASSELCRARPAPRACARVEQATILSLGTIFVAGELAVVSGAVSEEAATTAELEVNGHQVAIAASGSFAASVELAGASALTLSLTTETRETITIEIPLRASAIRARVFPAHDGPSQTRLRLVSA